jgi:hypothetical protein
VRINLAYPGHRPYVHLAPAARRRAISARYREDYRQLTPLLRGRPYQRLGSHLRPTGAALHLPLNQLPALLAEAVVHGVWVEAIEGLAPRVAEPGPSF